MTEPVGRTTDTPLVVDVPTQGNKADFIFHRLLAAGDFLAIAIALAGAVLVSSSTGRPVDPPALAVTGVIMLPVWLLLAYLAGLYHEIESRIDHNYVNEIGKVAMTATAWCWFFVLVRAVIEPTATDLLTPFLTWFAMVPLLLLSRSAVRRISRGRTWNRRTVATIGDHEGVDSLLTRIARHSEWGLDVVLSIELDPDKNFVVRDDEANETLIGTATFQSGPGVDRRGARERALAEVIKSSGVDRTIVAGGFQDLYSRTRLIHELVERGVAVDYISGGPETLYSRAVLHDLEGLPVLSVRPTSPRPIARRLKRAVDLALSSIGLILAAPVLAWAAVRIRMDSEGPVIYRQRRCGLNGEAFELLKLRTMVDGAHEMRPQLREETRDDGNDGVLFKLDGDPRVTAIGSTLRRLSIDEIPQLWNVFKGDMSMVGPRPLVFEEARQATDLFSARTRVKPGIAGPWQALGRSTIPFEDMVKLDYAYVVGWSMTEDFRLLLRTAGAVTRRSGAL